MRTHLIVTTAAGRMYQGRNEDLTEKQMEQLTKFIQDIRSLKSFSLRLNDNRKAFFNPKHIAVIEIVTEP